MTVSPTVRWHCTVLGHDRPSRWALHGLLPAVVISATAIITNNVLRVVDVVDTVQHEQLAGSDSSFDLVPEFESTMALISASDATDIFVLVLCLLIGVAWRLGSDPALPANSRCSSWAPMSEEKEHKRWMHTAIAYYAAFEIFVNYICQEQAGTGGLRSVYSVGMDEVEDWLNADLSEFKLDASGFHPDHWQHKGWTLFIRFFIILSRFAHLYVSELYEYRQQDDDATDVLSRLISYCSSRRIGMNSGILSCGMQALLYQRSVAAIPYYMCALVFANVQYNIASAKELDSAVKKRETPEPAPKLVPEPKPVAAAELEPEPVAEAAVLEPTGNWKLTLIPPVEPTGRWKLAIEPRHLSPFAAPEPVSEPTPVSEPVSEPEPEPELEPEPEPEPENILSSKSDREEMKQNMSHSVSQLPGEKPKQCSAAWTRIREFWDALYHQIFPLLHAILLFCYVSVLVVWSLLPPTLISPVVILMASIAGLPKEQANVDRQKNRATVDHRRWEYVHFIVLQVVMTLHWLFTFVEVSFPAFDEFTNPLALHREVQQIFGWAALLLLWARAKVKVADRAERPASRGASCSGKRCSSLPVVGAVGVFFTTLVEPLVVFMLIWIGYSKLNAINFGYFLFGIGLLTRQAEKKTTTAGPKNITLDGAVFLFAIVAIFIKLGFYLLPAELFDGWDEADEQSAREEWNVWTKLAGFRMCPQLNVTSIANGTSALELTAENECPIEICAEECRFSTLAGSYTVAVLSSIKLWMRHFDNVPKEVKSNKLNVKSILKVFVHVVRKNAIYFLLIMYVWAGLQDGAQLFDIMLLLPMFIFLPGYLDPTERDHGTAPKDTDQPEPESESNFEPRSEVRPEDVKLTEEVPLLAKPELEPELDHLQRPRTCLAVMWSVPLFVVVAHFMSNFAFSEDKLACVATISTMHSNVFC